LGAGCVVGIFSGAGAIAFSELLQAEASPSNGIFLGKMPPSDALIRAAAIPKML
jgi:hypothetical protein